VGRNPCNWSTYNWYNLFISGLEVTVNNKGVPVTCLRYLSKKWSDDKQVTNERYEDSVTKKGDTG
jgi:hypothetical protein